jgi:REP element-mobilizing transposase RayT
VTFSTEEDHQTYLRVLKDNLSDSEVRLLGWCMITNHVHLIPIPGREDSLAALFRRVHGRYAGEYTNFGLKLEWKARPCIDSGVMFYVHGRTTRGRTAGH